MSVKTGVWIDHKQAILVMVTDSGKETKKISSGIEKPDRTKSSHTYTPNDYVPEDRLERKFESQLKEFYDEVIASIQGSEALLIIGPGEAKGEFHKRLKSKKLRGLIVELETADKMTDRQLAAKVAAHFATVPAKKAVTAKKPAKKPTATAKPKTPAKKSGK